MEVQSIPPQSIRQPKYLARPVLMQSVEYTELLDSIQQHGILNGLLVRPVAGAAGDGYELVDGNWRLTAARELGIAAVPCVVREMSDKQAMACQIAANHIRKETGQKDLARHLQKLAENLSVPEIARMVNKSSQWVRGQLFLNQLGPNIDKLIDAGKIPLCNAYLLGRMAGAKINPKYYVNQAMTMPVAEFRKMTTQAIREQRATLLRGELPRAGEFKPQPWLRPIKHLLEVMGSAEHSDDFKEGIRYALSLDPLGIENQRKRAERKKGS